MRCIGFTIKYAQTLRYIPPNQKLVLSVLFRHIQVLSHIFCFLRTTNHRWRSSFSFLSSQIILPFGGISNQLSNAVVSSTSRFPKQGVALFPGQPSWYITNKYATQTRKRQLSNKCWTSPGNRIRSLSHSMPSTASVHGKNCSAWGLAGRHAVKRADKGSFIFTLITESLVSPDIQKHRGAPVC